MLRTEIYDLNEYPVNERNGTYGGNAGDKEGITINGEYWIVKYPKSTAGMKGDLLSYATSPLSEYLGSHIYEILGIDTHKTLLGFRNDKIVVACKDFCKNEGALREIRTLKNIYNSELSKKLEQSFSSTSSSHLIDLNQMMVQLDYNPILKSVLGVRERFWDMFVIDILINNNDRNNGNWGLLYENGKYNLAPVFDNGASFSNKLPDNRIVRILNNTELLEDSALNGRTVYDKSDGKPIYFREINKIQYPDFYESIKRNTKKIKDNMADIISLINTIPKEYKGITVCTEERKQFYSASLGLRFERILEPIYKEIELKIKNGNTSSVSINEKHRKVRTLSELSAYAKEQYQKQSTELENKVGKDEISSDIGDTER